VASCRESKLLSPEHVDGHTYLVIAPPQTEPSGEKAGNRRARPNTRPLNRDELDMAEGVMDLLTGLDQHFMAGLAVSAVRRDVAGDVGVTEFNKIVRVLESQGLVSRRSQADSRKVRKNTRVHLATGDVRGEWIKNRKTMLEKLSSAQVRV
jgi:hypothetical protein